MQLPDQTPRQLTVLMAANLGLLRMGLADASDWSDGEIGAALPCTAQTDA